MLLHCLASIIGEKMFMEVKIAFVNSSSLRFRDRVRESYTHLLCKYCGFFHRSSPLYFHQGKWNGLTFFDINHHRKSTFRMRDKINIVSTGGKKAAVVTLVAIGGGLVGAVIAAPLFVLGVLVKSSDIIGTAVSIPLRTAAAAGGAVFNAYNPKAELTRWDCCGREGTYAKPCKLCLGDTEIIDVNEEEEYADEDLHHSANDSDDDQQGNDNNNN